MTTTPLHQFLSAGHPARVLPLACLLLLAALPAARAAGPAAAGNPLEAPPTLSAADAADGNGEGEGPRAGNTSAARDALPAAPRSAASARRDAPDLAPSAADPDWRFRLNLASAPGDRPSSTPLAQRAVKLSLSRSF